jgi:hypothetical protein
MLFTLQGNRAMGLLELDSFQDFVSIPIKDKWTKCTVGLEHSVRGDYYWLACEIKFYVGNETDLYIHIGNGSRSDADLVFSTLEKYGFKQTLKRFMREWEYLGYQRNPTRETLEE